MLTKCHSGYAFCSLSNNIIIANSDESKIYNFDCSKFLVLLKREVSYKESNLWTVFFRNKIHKFVIYDDADSKFYQIL
jgi:hypothetical protein